MISVIIGLLIILAGVAYCTPLSKIFDNKKPAVMVINVDGEVITTSFFGTYEKRDQNRTNATSSDMIIRTLDYFSKDDSIKAFILEINSWGGQTTGKVEIERYIKKMNKPVVAVIKGEALSSGYYVAASTNKIYAEPSSKIGEITDYFVYVNRNRHGREEICYITSSNYETITLDDCRGFESDIFWKLQSLVKGTHEFLVSRIAEMRGLSAPTVENIPSDTIMSSEEALNLKLVDEIGTTYDAVNWLEEKLGTKLWIVYLRDMMPQ